MLLSALPMKFRGRAPEQVAGHPSVPNALINDYLEGLDRGATDPQQRTVRVICRSTKSDLATAIWGRLRDFHVRQAKVFAVVASADWGRHERKALRAYAEVFGDIEAVANIRLFRFGNWRNIVEQLQLGAASVWTDVEDIRDKPSIVPTDAIGEFGQKALAPAIVAFELVWAVSCSLPRDRLG